MGAEKMIVELEHVRVNYASGAGSVSAIDDVSVSLKPGETFGLVGESGCGKTTLAMSFMGLLPPSARVSGQIIFDGRDLADLSPAERADLNGNRVGMVFQDASTSLDPIFGVGSQIADTIRTHQKVSRKAAKSRALELLTKVGIADAQARYNEPPHRLSGGMRQRVVVAAALANDPALLIADEPTTALDVTIQAQILDLLQDLQTEFGTTILFVAHDLGVVAQICDRVGVMYAGQLVEVAAVDDLFASPQHPYTRALLDALPGGNSRSQGLRVIPGHVPDLSAPQPGCRFADRCALRMPECDIRPPLTPFSDTSEIACWAHPATRAAGAQAAANGIGAFEGVHQ